APMVGTTRGDWNISIAQGSMIFMGTGSWTPISIGSLANADALCAGEAAAAGLSGTWLALLSTETVNAKNHVVFTYPVVGIDGTILERTDMWGSTHEGFVRSRTGGNVNNIN